MKKLATLFVAAALCASSSYGKNGETPGTTIGHTARDLMPEFSLFQRGGRDDLEANLLLTSDFPDFLGPQSDAALIAISSSVRSGPPTEFAVRLEAKGASYVIIAAVPSVTLTEFYDFGKERELLREIRRTAANRALAVTSQELEDKNKELAAASEQIRVKRQQRHFTRCEIPLDAGRGGRIMKVWTAMVYRSSFSEHPSPLEDSDQEPGTHLELDYHFTSGFASGVAVRPFSGDKPGVLATLGTAMFDYCMTKNGEALTRIDNRLDRLELLLAKASRCQGQ